MFNILVLCTGNSARSILAEAIFNRDGAGRVMAFSAGSNPTGVVHSAALRLLERRGLPIAGFRSKSWDEFAAKGAPRMDLVITVCAAAAAEVCPTWPGAPLTANWAVDDPASAPVDQIDLAFQASYHRLSTRINAFLALPFEMTSYEALAAHLSWIGKS